MSDEPKNGTCVIMFYADDIKSRASTPSVLVQPTVGQILSYYLLSL